MTTLVNCLTVPAGREEDFMEVYRTINAHMAGQPGYVGNRLHRSLDPAAAYRFVNVVEWASPQACAAAHGEGFQALMANPEWRFFTSTPGLYDVAHVGGDPLAPPPLG